MSRFPQNRPGIISAASAFLLPLAVGLAGCGPAVMAQEAAYMKALEPIASYESRINHP
jgi:hypothetical protein